MWEMAAKFPVNPAEGFPLENTQEKR